MNWLEAVLAFSLVMLVLATIVTLVLETGYRFLSTREKGFRLMMERLFDEVLKPRIAHRLRSVTLEQARATLADLQQLIGQVRPASPAHPHQTLAQRLDHRGSQSLSRGLCHFAGKPIGFGVFDAEGHGIYIQSEYLYNIG